jgi:hypothetical protein
MSQADTARASALVGGWPVSAAYAFVDIGLNETLRMHVRNKLCFLHGCVMQRSY